MDSVVRTLQALPELALFLCLALGYAIGSVKVKGFGLGSVVGTLAVAMLVGQAHVEIHAFAKTVFFALFIYAVGFKSGPEFFGGLNRSSLKLVASAFSESPQLAEVKAALAGQ